MSGLKIAHFPGFQQGHQFTEYELSEEECRRLITDNSQRRPKPALAIAKDLKKVTSLLVQFARIDWASFKSEENKILVDDADIYFFEGDFGKVSFPLSYALERGGLNPDFAEQCVSLFELFQTMGNLEFV